MKLRLIVMRHAKAGELPGGPDSERALRERGRRDAGAAGRWLRDHDLVPEAVICSSARRTRQTWQYLSAELGGGAGPGPDPGRAVPGRTVPGRAVPGRAFTADPRLYRADVADLLEIIAATAAPVTSLMYIGHNPAAAELAAGLTGARPDFPTAAIAVIDLPGPWADIAPGTGELVATWTPRQDG